MKSIFITFLFAVIAMFSFAQMPQMHHQPKHFKMPHIDMKQYEVLDSLPLEKITIYSPYDYDGDDVIHHEHRLVC